MGFSVNSFLGPTPDCKKSTSFQVISILRAIVFAKDFLYQYTIHSGYFKARINQELCQKNITSSYFAIFAPKFD